jgi:phenylacetate-CoA ligase
MDKLTFLTAPFMFLNLMRNKNLRRNQIITLQNKKLRRLIKHSFEHVYYYNRLFRTSGIRPEDIRTVDDLKKIPISRKTDLSNLDLKEKVASNMDLRKANVAKTSGSSGINLEFYRGKKDLVTNLLRHYLFALEVGDKPHNRRIEIGHLLPRPFPFGRIGFFPTKDISPFENTMTYIKEIKAFDPSVLLGFPSSIRVIAKEIINQQIKVKIPMIFAGGEVVDIHTRQLAKTAFDAEIFETYGMTEVGGICGECRFHRGQHVWGDQVIVEIIRDGEKISPGERGLITVTSLSRHYTPFIRYNTEDIGILIDTDCVCGSQFQLMKITEGRSSDTILLNNGRVVSAHGVCADLNAFSGVKQLQVIQESRDRFTVKVVEINGFHNNPHKEIVEYFRQRIGKVDVKVSVVDEIPRLKSGKLKLFISKLHSP